MIIFKPQYPDVMNTNDVCEILNISKNHCLMLLNSNKLKGFKINNSRAWRVTGPALEEFISNSYYSVIPKR